MLQTETDHLSNWLERASQFVIADVFSYMDTSELVINIINGAFRDECELNPRDAGTIAFCNRLIEIFNEECPSKARSMVELREFLIDEATLFTVMSHFSKERIESIYKEVRKKHLLPKTNDIANIVRQDAETLGNNELGLSVSIHHPEIFRSYLQSCPNIRRDFFQAVHYIKTHVDDWKELLVLQGVLVDCADQYQDADLHSDLLEDINITIKTRFSEIEETGIPKMKKIILLAQETSDLLKGYDQIIQGVCFGFLQQLLKNHTTLFNRVCFLEAVFDLRERETPFEKEFMEMVHERGGYELIDQSCKEKNFQENSIAHLYWVVILHKKIVKDDSPDAITRDILEDIVENILLQHPDEDIKKISGLFDYDESMQKFIFSRAHAIKKL